MAPEKQKSPSKDQQRDGDGRFTERKEAVTSPVGGKSGDSKAGGSSKSGGSKSSGSQGSKSR